MSPSPAQTCLCGQAYNPSTPRPHCSLLDVADNKELKNRVEQLLGSKNFLTNLSAKGWDDLQNYCWEQAMALGMDMEGYSLKSDQSTVIRNGLDELFLNSHGKPKHMDLFSTAEEAKHRYQVVPHERTSQSEWLCGEIRSLFVSTFAKTPLFIHAISLSVMKRRGRTPFFVNHFKTLKLPPPSFC